MKLIYDVKDKPNFSKCLVFSFQQVLAIITATLAVPTIINNICETSMDQASALFGAGVGTIIYLLFTKFRSPVFLGSSFAFIGSMCSAFAGASTMALGYLGLIIGAILAGLVYAIISILVKKFGSDWINKLMPPIVIGPIVAIIGLSLSTNAIQDFTNGSGGSTYVAIACGLVTLFTTIIVSTYSKKSLRLIPFIIGIFAGYIFACLFYFIGSISNNDALKVINFESLKNCFNEIKFSSFLSIPRFTFIESRGVFSELNISYFITLITAYVPVAFVVFAEHIADHKNLSSIIEKDLLSDPGLNRTLLGDGIGSMLGAFFGGCPNTTYGESIGCVAITGNASSITIVYAAIMCMLISFFTPFIAFLQTIPTCVMGGVCIALYGFIATSGLKIMQTVDLNDNKNMFVSSIILITGVGGLVFNIGAIEIRTVACALILGIIANKVLSNKK